MAGKRTAVILGGMVAATAVLSACARTVAPSPDAGVDVRQWLARGSAMAATPSGTSSATASSEPHLVGEGPVGEGPADDPSPPEEQSSSGRELDEGQRAPEQDGTGPHPASRRAGEPTGAGQHVSLDFHDANIRDMFRVLADVSGLNIVVTDEVDKHITVHLEDVPWNEALDLLLESNGIGKQWKENVLRVSTLERLKAERDAARNAREAEEKMEVLQSTFLKLNYTQAADLAKKLKPVLSKRGVTIADDRSNTLFVRDVKHVLDDVVELGRQFDTRPVQVLIESNLIETTPTFARALGMQLEFSAGKTKVNSNFGAEDPFSAFVGATMSVIGAKMGPIKDINAALTAAEKQGQVRIISRPSVVTLNNVPSTIKSVRVLRVSLPTGTTNIATGTNAQQGQAVATEQIPIGITLTVTPQVSKDHYILLSIKVKSSSVGGVSPPNGIPDELTREAVSNVIVHDSETVVIGGILKDMSERNQNGIPFLEDMPVLGWLFKRVQQQRDLEELMVFITPRIAVGGSPDLAGAEQQWRATLKTTSEEWQNRR